MLDKSKIAALKERCQFVLSHGFHLANSEHYAMQLEELCGEITLPVGMERGSPAHVLALIGAIEAGVVKAPAVEPKVKAASPKKSEPKQAKSAKAPEAKVEKEPEVEKVDEAPVVEVVSTPATETASEEKA